MYGVAGLTYPKDTYKLRLFASPNLWESICDRFHGGFISGQTESGNPWGLTEKRK